MAYAYDYNVESFLEILNPQQRAAVSVSDGPALILAGPGSGKTRVLTHRVAWLLAQEQVLPWRVLAVTFTNKAAREMRDRLGEMLDPDAVRDMSIGTFHATCARILRREAEWAGLDRSYLIFDSDDQVAVVKQVVKALGLDDKRYRPRALHNAISRAKNELIGPADYPVFTYYDEVAKRVYTHYQETLRENNALDFDDLLVEPVKLFRQNPEVLEKYRHRFRYVLVDEFQDTNVAQYTLLRLLTREHRSLFVVADEDQSIYSWRGADYRNIQRLRNDYPELVEILLTENYRSTQIILDAAQAVIARNLDRTPKELFTRKEGGKRIVLREAYDEQEEAAFVVREVQSLGREGYSWSDVAVMYRTNAQSRALEEAFVNAGIPYRLIGGTRFYSRMEIKDILAFLRLVENPDDDISFLRIVGTPPRGIGARTVAKITAQAEREGASRFRAAQSLLLQGTLGTRTHNAVEAFVDMVEAWRAEAEELSVTQLLDRVLADTEYEPYLRDGTEEGEGRWENVMALRAVTAEAPEVTLLEFLTEVALVADVDEIDEAVEAVTLLTLHSAKGLEYPAVFLTGLEEGMLPHSRSIEESPSAVEEERRLLYVGMTRSEERLYLTHVFRRNWYGSSEPAMPSRFLEDLPEEVLASAQRRPTSQPASTSSWNTPSWGETMEKQRPQSRPRVERQFDEGQRVRHRRYGEGIVQESRVEGGDEIVTVLFFDNQVKNFLVGVAPLEPVSKH